jgi:protein tyrosine phosphatase (PTP) superfamily phosphohydrolase (DUF442 family)
MIRPQTATGGWNLKRAIKVASLLLLLAVVAAGSPYLWWEMNYFLTTVTPGRFYRAKIMPPQRLASLCSDLGIQTVVDLRDTRSKEGAEKRKLLESIAAEKKALASVGTTYYNVESRQSRSNRVAVQQYLEILDNTNAWPVLVHCKDGVGRSGVFTALYLMEYEDQGNIDALREVAAWKTYRPRGRKNFRHGEGKADFILEYQTRRDKRADSPH